MDYIINFLINNEYIVMIGLFISIIVLLVIVSIMDFVNIRKNRKKCKDLLNDKTFNFENAFKEEINEEDFTRELEIFEDEKVLDVPEIKYVEEDPELEKTKAKLELENIKQELAKIEAEEKLKVQEIVSHAKETSFEQKQEENAILSIEEFDKLKEQLYEESTIEEAKAEEEIPISIDQLEYLYNTQELKTIEMPSEFTLNDDKSTKFKSSPIISPVFGIDTNPTISINIKEKIDNIEKEIESTNEFLESLKEFRKTLE